MPHLLHRNDASRPRGRKQGGLERHDAAQPLLEGARYSRDHFQRFKNAIYDVGLELGGSYYRFGGVMKPYVRRMFGDAMVDRHRAMKQQLDPSFILNRDVVFDPPEAA